MLSWWRREVSPRTKPMCYTSFLSLLPELELVKFNWLNKYYYKIRHYKILYSYVSQIFKPPKFMKQGMALCKYSVNVSTICTEIQSPFVI